MTGNKKLGSKNQYFEEQFLVEKVGKCIKKIVKNVKLGGKWYFEIKNYFGENVTICSKIKSGGNWNSNNWNALGIDSSVWMLFRFVGQKQVEGYVILLHNRKGK